MFISDAFISSFRDDPVNGVIRLRTELNECFEQAADWSEVDYENLLEAYALLVEAEELGLLYISTGTWYEPSGDMSKDCRTLNGIISSITDECRIKSKTNLLESIRKRTKLNLSGGFMYEFSKGDLERIQALISELRTSPDFRI